MFCIKEPHAPVCLFLLLLSTCVSSLVVQSRTVPGPFFSLGSNSSITLFIGDVPSTHRNLSDWNVWFDLCPPELTQCSSPSAEVAAALRCSKSSSILHSDLESIFVCHFDTSLKEMERLLSSYLSYQFRVSIQTRPDFPSTGSLLPLVLHPREWNFSTKYDETYGNFLIGSFVYGEIFLSYPDETMRNNLNRWQYDFKISAQCQTADNVDTSFEQRTQNASHFGYSFQIYRSKVSFKCQYSLQISTTQGIVFSQVPLALWHVGAELSPVGLSSRQAVIIQNSTPEPILWVVPFQKLPPELADTSRWTFSLIPGVSKGCRSAGLTLSPTKFTIYSGISLEATISLSQFTPHELHDCIIAAKSAHPFNIEGKLIVPGTLLLQSPALRLWNNSHASDLAAKQHAVLEVIIDNDIDVSTNWRLRGDGIYPWCQCSLSTGMFAIRLYESLNVWRISFQVPDISGCNLSLLVEKSGLLQSRRIDAKSAPMLLGAVGGPLPQPTTNMSSMTFSVRSGSSSKQLYWRSVPARIKDHVASWITSVFSVNQIGHMTQGQDIAIDFSEEFDVRIRFLTDAAITACLIQKQNCANHTALQLWGSPDLPDYAVLPTGFSFWCTKSDDGAFVPVSWSAPQEPLPWILRDKHYLFILVGVILMAFPLIHLGSQCRRSFGSQAWLLHPEHLHEASAQMEEYQPVEQLEILEREIQPGGEVQECPVCLDAAADAECEPCKHQFCQSCIKQLKGRCAVCRAPFAVAYVLKVVVAVTEPVEAAEDAEFV